MLVKVTLELVTIHTVLYGILGPVFVLLGVGILVRAAERAKRLGDYPPGLIELKQLAKLGLLALELGLLLLLGGAYAVGVVLVLGALMLIALDGLPKLFQGSRLLVRGVLLVFRPVALESDAAEDLGGGLASILAGSPQVEVGSEQIKIVGKE